MWHCVLFHSDGKEERFDSDNHYLLMLFARSMTKAKMCFSAIVYDENENVRFSFFAD